MPEPIGDDQLVYRWLNDGWASSDVVNSLAFVPGRNDEDGISLWDSRFGLRFVMERAAEEGMSRVGLAALPAGAVRAAERNGLRVELREAPPDDPAHLLAVFPGGLSRNGVRKIAKQLKTQCTVLLAYGTKPWQDRLTHDGRGILDAEADHPGPPS